MSAISEQTEEAVGAAWVSDVAFEGVSTGDGRYIADGAINWREPPLTLMAMIETPGMGGHAGAQVAGRMDYFTKADTAMDGEPLPKGVLAVFSSGVFDVGEYGSEIERMVGENMLTGVSVDLAVNEWAFRNPETGEIIQKDDATEEDWEKAFMGEYEFAILDATIMAATVCPTPAFANAAIQLRADARLPMRAHFWVAEDGLMMTTFAAPIRRADALSAAAAAPVAPPREFFYAAEADRATPLTITDDGHVYGHIAAWHSCHTGFINGAWSQCVTPPRSNTGYAHFHVGEIPTAEGELVPIGKLMLGENHAPAAAGRTQARAHYDRTGSVGAYVRAVDGEHGIWVSGVLSDRLTDAQRRDLHANPPSGDWREVDRNLELIAAIAVPVPGFPIPRSQLALSASADGELFVSALILTSSVESDAADAAPEGEAETLAAEIEAGADGLHALIAG